MHDHQLRINGRKPKQLFVVLLCLFLLFCGAAQPTQVSAQTGEPLRFDYLSVNNGLSDTSVIDIIQDRQGFMWFGTENGLNRYDGYEFVVYTHDPNDTNSLSQNSVTVVYQDDAGILWVGTRGGGLNRLDPQTEQISRYQHQPTDSQTISSDFINAIDIDGQGNLWLGTENGLDYFDPVTATAVHYPFASEPPPNPDYLNVRDVVVSPDQTIWIATTGGLAWLLPNANRVSYSSDAAGIQDIKINCLHIDEYGFAWVGADDGLYKLDANQHIIAHYQHDPANSASLATDVIWTIYEDSQARIWLGTRGGGLALFDPAAETFTHYRADPDKPNSLNSDFVLAIYEDRAGTLWVSGWTAGLNLSSPYEFKFPPSIRVNSLPLAIYEEANGQLWTGTLGQGLAHIDPATGAAVYYRHISDDPNSLSNDTVFALQSVEEGLWVGTLDGFGLFDPVTETFTRYPTNPAEARYLSGQAIRSLYVDDVGDVWLGTDLGLNRFDPENGRVTAYNHLPNGPGSISIWDIHPTDATAFWIGTADGLFYFDRTTDTFQNYAQVTDTQGVGVMVIYEDDDGILWLGSWGQGLIRFDPVNQTSIYYQNTTDLPGNIVLGILPDAAGNLWLSTNRGISKFNPATEQFRTYDKADGLDDDDFVQGAYWQNAQGEMFWGIENGIVHFYPHELKNNPYAAPVYLVDFQLFNQPVPVDANSPLKQSINYTSEIVLTHDQSVFSLEFAALNFIAPEQNHYLYKMEGVDPEWNAVQDRRFVTYTNLDPGEYDFRVRAANNDGVWSDDEAVLHIIVKPPWWRSWAAYLVYAAALFAGLFGYNRFRIRLQKQALANQQRELLWERRLRESLERADRLKDKERARIARELHDGLAQTLAGIRFRTRTWKTIVNMDPERLLPELDDLSTILDDSIQDVRRSIYALRPLFLEELGLETAVSQFAANLGKLYEVDIQLEFQNITALPSALEHNLFRIIQELLYNAVQHGRPQTTWVQIKVLESELFIQIEDDGIGFDLQQMPTHHEKGHFGLKQVRERVALLKGQMSLTSLPDQGTSISISLPIN